MTGINAGRIALQVRIGLARIGVIPGVIAISLLLGTAPWIWFAMNVRDSGQQELALTQARHGLSALSAANGAAQRPVAEQNLDKFYAVLGNRSETEQHLKALFAIATQTGLSLDQGEYQWQVDKNSSTYRYHVLLPVKGPYGAIRRFCEKTLKALPFASLDELSFKRESAAEDEPDASLRFTLYLKDALLTPPTAGRAE